MARNLGVMHDYPKLLKNTPVLDSEIKVLGTNVVVMDDGTFYHLIFPDTAGAKGKRVIGLFSFESLFKPEVKIPKVVEDFVLERMVTEEQVIDHCLPANWRLTAAQQEAMPGYIAASLERWRELMGESNVDKPPTEE